MHKFITVCVGKKYPTFYVNALYRQVKNNFKAPFEFYCVADELEGADPGIKWIPAPIALPGWWNKLYLYSPYMPKGRLVYLDLDVVILQDFTDLIVDYHGDFMGDEDHIHFGHTTFGTGNTQYALPPIDCSLGTALVVTNAHQHLHLWQFYIDNKRLVEEVFATHGDQVYVSWRLGGCFDLLERVAPDTHGFYSYKFDIKKCKVELSQCKFINFHGHPKPHESGEEFVRMAWGFDSLPVYKPPREAIKRWPPDGNKRWIGEIHKKCP